MGNTNAERQRRYRARQRQQIEDLRAKIKEIETRPPQAPSTPYNPDLDPGDAA